MANSTLQRPTHFPARSWHDASGDARLVQGGYPLSIPISVTLAALERLGGNPLPDELADEQQIRAFADQAFVRLTDADIESVMIFPNKQYASRAWVKELYQQFWAFCVEHGYERADPSHLPPADTSLTPPQPVAESDETFVSASPPSSTSPTEPVPFGEVPVKRTRRSVPAALATV